MWTSLRNEISFWIRKSLPRLRFSAYAEKLKTPISQDILPSGLAQRLNEKNLRLNLFYRWILDQVPVDFKNQQELKALDLGSMNFFYVGALSFWLSTQAPQFELTGLELDPYRMYINLRRRGEHADYYVSLVQSEFKNSKIHYKMGNWLEHPASSYDLITSFFPFLFEDLHDRFGLPRKAFGPADFYEKAFKESRYILFFHQGAEEARESRQLISKHSNVQIIFDGIFKENPWMSRKHPVHVLLVERIKEF